MNPIPSAGLIIGGACALWMFFMGITGWYKDPVLLRAFFAVIPIEIAGLVWGLRRTAPDRGYTSQIVAGTMMAIVAGIILIAASLLFTTVAYPRYFEELAQAHREVLQQRGLAPADIERQVREAQAGATPMGHAIQGFLGTLITGIVGSAVIAIRLRKR